MENEKSLEDVLNNAQSILAEMLKNAKEQARFNQGNLNTVQFPSADDNENKEKE